ncbi:MAG TPA: HAD-IA family hydrolase [Chthoniobacterales bacterium]|jgi:putative hydrolase of the HAD superfamily|nr:HAD-IA family hydrolase [Chthoniobacterales bacterium]
MAKRRAIFFDAAGTLIGLTKSVGENYALVAKRQGLQLEAASLDRAFAEVWRAMPLRPATGEPREDDDKGWWRELVDRVLDRVSAQVDPLDRDTFFEAAYGHFAEAGVWELYPDVIEVLEELAPRFFLAVVSNFDSRLRVIFEHLAVSKYFRFIFLSSELGADKPDPLIYRRALEISGFAPNEVLHVGDDRERDWEAAAAAGLEVFRLERPHNSLRDLPAFR